MDIIILSVIHFDKKTPFYFKVFISLTKWQEMDPDFKCARFSEFKADGVLISTNMGGETGDDCEEKSVEELEYGLEGNKIKVFFKMVETVEIEGNILKVTDSYGTTKTYRKKEKKD